MNEEDLILEHIDYLSRVCGFAERTIARHNRVSFRWLEFLHNEKKITLLEAKPDDLVSWIVHRRNDGIKDITLRAELCVLRTLYEYLFDYNHITKNPAVSLPELICRPADEQEYLTVEECRAYLDGFDRKTNAGLRNYTMAALLWSTGIRSSELCSLKWQDIDLDKGTLLVRKGKGGRQRLLFLNDRVWEDLQQYRKEREHDKSDDPVFRALGNNKHSGGKRPGALTTWGMADMLNGHGKKLGFTKHVSAQMFRHTFATHMLEAGAGLDELQELLGHDDETETCRYIHVTVEAAKRLLSEHNGGTDNNEEEGR